MEFRQIVVIGAAAALVAIVVHFLAVGRKAKAVSGGTPAPRALRILERLAYAAAALGLLTLASTGFYSALVLNARMTGFVLLAHVSAGGLFAAGLAVLTAFRAESSRFAVIEEDALPERFYAGQKVLFWVIALLGLTALLSILFSMLPFFGTSGQAELYAIHRYCAVGILMAAIGYGYYGLLPCGCAGK